MTLEGKDNAMKSIFRITSIILLALALTGCYPTGKRTPNAGTNIDDIMSEAEKIENFSLSLTLPETYPTELPKIMAAVMRWDKETVYEVLGGGRPILSEDEFESVNYPDEKRTLLTLDDKRSYISFEPESVGYNAPLDGEVNHSIYFSEYDTYFVNPMVSYVSELEGFSSESAVQRVRDVAKKLGITNLGDPIVFGVTADIANNYICYQKRECDFYDEPYGDDDFKAWTKDDEAYYITFPLMYEGIPLENNGVYVPGYSYAGSYVKAIVTKDKIIDLNCMGITSPEYIIGDPAKINFSAKDILSKIVSDYSRKVLPIKLEIYNCELTYAPVDKLDNNEWVFAPVWRFDYASYNEYYYVGLGNTAENATRQIEIYNAETGNKIVYD